LLLRPSPISVCAKLLLVALSACAAAERPLGSPAAQDPSDLPCTQIGCFDGFSVELQSPSGYKPGSYKVTVETDLGTSICEVSLPLPSCETVASPRCSPGLPVLLGLSACALPPEQHALGPIQLPGAQPTHVSLKVERDGQVIGSGEYTPVYRTLQPNGPRCEPVCRQAEGTLTLR